MGFFGGDSKVTHHEFRKAIFRLKDEGFSDSEIEEVKSAFRGDLDEEGSGSGISKEELKKGLLWFREHANFHHLNPHQIEKVETALKHYL